jgi:hypothetical protein
MSLRLKGADDIEQARQYATSPPRTTVRAIAGMIAR